MTERVRKILQASRVYDMKDYGKFILFVRAKGPDEVPTTDPDSPAVCSGPAFRDAMIDMCVDPGTPPTGATNFISNNGIHVFHYPETDIEKREFIDHINGIILERRAKRKE